MLASNEESVQATATNESGLDGDLMDASHTMRAHVYSSSVLRAIGAHTQGRDRKLGGATPSRGEHKSARTRCIEWLEERIGRPPGSSRPLTKQQTKHTAWAADVSTDSYLLSLGGTWMWGVSIVIVDSVFIHTATQDILLQDAHRHFHRLCEASRRGCMHAQRANGVFEL